MLNIDSLTKDYRKGMLKIKHIVLENIHVDSSGFERVGVVLKKFGIFFAYYRRFAIFAIPFSRVNVRARKHFH